MKTQTLWIAMLLLVAPAVRAQELAEATSERVTESVQNTQSTPPETNSNNAPQVSPSSSSPAQQNAQLPSQAPSNSTIDNTIDASESDGDLERNHLIPRPEIRTHYFTLRFGAGFLYEVAGFSQDHESKEQIGLRPEGKLRDFRFLLGGTFPTVKRVSWSFGIMYDAPTSSWLIRQTGVMIAVPEIWGRIFIGRTKEGFSLNKVMTGYDGWTMERFTMNDATIPILSDGIKWLGYVPKLGILWNIGYFNDVFSKGQSFSTYSSQEVVRVAWLPVLSDEKRSLLHLGMNLRYGNALDGQLRLKSRPEAFPAPFFVDTGTFAAKSTIMTGYEVYYRKGPWMFGSEYWWTHTSSRSEGNPLFRGGDVVATWLITGETRAYDTAGGFFREIVPRRAVINKGPGAWEALLRFSDIDLDSHAIQGGKFWRITPGVNWYLTDNVRLELEYGLGRLNRFGLNGYTQFFQTRIQLQL
jgi:phosphate-selective porin OprO/OprP